MQPMEGLSSESWRIYGRLRHLLHNMEVYVKRKEEMIVEYREFKVHKSTNNFRMLQALERIQERLLSESLPAELSLN